MAGQKSVTLSILANNAEAVAAIDDTKAKYEELKAEVDAGNLDISPGQLKSAYTSEMRANVKALFADIDSGSSNSHSKLLQLGADVGKISLGLGGIGAASAGVSALVPVAAVASGGILALGSSVASVGAGFGLFGVIAEQNIKKAMSGTTGLTSAQKDLRRNIQWLQADWHEVINDMSGIVAKTLIPTLGILPDVLNTIESMMRTMAPAFEQVGQSVAKALDGKALSDFMMTLAQHAATDIPKVVDIFGHLASIAGKVITAFAPMGDKILTVIDKLTQKADAGTNNALSHFIDYIDKNGPNVVKALANLAGAFKSMGGVLAGEGQIVAIILPPLTSLLKVIASNPVGANALAGLLVLTKLGGAPAVLGLISGGLTKIVGGVKEWMLAQEALTVVNKEGAIASIAAWGLVGVAILAIGAIIFLIIKYHTQLWDAAKAVWAGIKSAAEAVWTWLQSTAESVFGWLKSNWPLLLGILTGPIGLAVEQIVTHWNTIKNGALDVVHSITSWFSALPGQMLSIGENIIRGLINGIENMAGNIASTVENLALNAIESPFKAALSIFSPSRVFMVHGQNIVAGLVSGIDGSANLATASVTRMASGVSNAGSASLNRSMATGSGMTVQLEWNQSGGDADFMSWLKRGIRTRGGNPGVLGR